MTARGASQRRERSRYHFDSLNSDHVEQPSHLGADVLDPVFTPIPLTGSQSRDPPFRLRSPIGAAHGPSQPMLRHRQPFRLTPSEAVCVQQFTCRQRSRNLDTAISAEHAALTLTGDSIEDVRECEVPAASSITGHAVRSGTFCHPQRQAEPHPSDLRHPDPTEAMDPPFDVTGFKPSCRNPSCTPASRHIGRRCVPVNKSAWPSRNPAAPVAAQSDFQHRMHAYSARASVNARPARR